MKTKLFLAAMLSVGIQQSILAQTDELGYQSVNLTMGANYQNQVFFDFSDNQTKSVAGDLWDIAFYRNSTMDFGIKVNDSKDYKVYQVSATASDFDTVDLSKLSTWGESLYNPDQTDRIQDGAFSAATLLPQSQFNYGWGSYDMVTHKILGKVVFVLQSADGATYKFFINEYYGGYTFKYAKWNGTSWDATQSKTIANGSDDTLFNYFSFATGAKVDNVEPAKANWNLMFTRYYTYYNNVMMYRLSGAVQSPNITVAKVQPETQATSTYTAPAAATYSANITSIGNSWKPTTGVYSDVVYYVKDGANYYRMYFTQNGGATTGNMYFKYKNITSELGVTDLGKKASFGFYPNPVTNKKATLIFDVKEKSNNKGSVEIYDLSGKKVYETSLSNQSGLYKQDLNLTNLSSGNYIAKITFGGITETKKIIIK